MSLFFRRALAYLLDLTVIYAACVLSSAVLILAYLSLRFSGDPEMIKGLMDRDAFRSFILANNFWMFFCYFSVCHWYWGKTLGKKLLGLQVKTNEGNELSFEASLARTGGYLLSGQLTLGLGFLVAAFRKDQLTLHDLLLKTKVVTETGVAESILLSKDSTSDPMQSNAAEEKRKTAA